MVFILFLFVSWDEQAFHGMRGSGINGIPVSWMGQPPHGKPKNVEERRNNRRHILQEPDQPGRNLLGLTSKPLPHRLHRRRWITLHWLKGTRRSFLWNHHLPRLLPSRFLHARLKLQKSSHLRRQWALDRQKKKGTAVGAALDAISVGGKMEEGALFFELTNPLIYPYFNSTALRSSVPPSPRAQRNNKLFVICF